MCDKDTDVCASTCHISRPFFGRFTFEVSFVRLSPLSRLGIEFGLFRNTAEKLDQRLQVTRDAWVLEKRVLLSLKFFCASCFSELLCQLFEWEQGQIGWDTDAGGRRTLISPNNRVRCPLKDTEKGC